MQHFIEAASAWRTGLVMLALAAIGQLPAGGDDTLRSSVDQLQRQLRQQVIPYWFDQAQDRQHGGYQLEAGSKQLVGQTRMIWGFARAHRHGLSTDERDLLAAAAQGYRFLQSHFLDREQGGYVWLTDDEGRVLNAHKMIYGQAFVIYALVEYYRASHDPEALAAALRQFRVIQAKAHDPQHGGWFEHFTPDWQAVMSPQPEVSIEVPGLKSANAHLHLMEALTELCAETPDAAVKQALRESLEINRRWFYPADPAKSAFHRQPDWSPATDRGSAGLSYGHNVEFAWLMLRAEHTLGQPLSWDHFRAHVDHALKYGYDREHGGLYSQGFDNQPAVDREKVWWCQAELIAALATALQHEPREDDRQVLDQLLRFMQRRMIDPVDGIWFWSVDGTKGATNATKKNHWKANYHDLRATIMLIDAYSVKP